MVREITKAMSVGQIAKDYPELIPELERLRIDFCCNGSRTLEESVALRGHDVQSVLDRLIEYVSPAAGGVDETDYTAMSMTELANHIEKTHHRFAREALDRLGVLIGKCVAAHGDDEPRLMELQDVFSALTEDMHDHFIREERVLFPWLRRLERKSEITSGPPWSVRRPIDCMVHDHDDVGEAFARIHSLTDDLTPPSHACSTWKECYKLLGELERDTHIHIHKENNILFPDGVKAEGLLSRK